jgi:hypothetical protein
MDVLGRKWRGRGSALSGVFRCGKMVAFLWSFVGVGGIPVVF